jgi:hypothetical protein
VPEGHEVGGRYAATRNGKSVRWRRLYRPLELGSEDEALVFLVAHEAFHYLRKTGQVPGRHGEIGADAFALEALGGTAGGRMPPVRRAAVPDELVAARPIGVGPLVASAGVRGEGPSTN